MKKQVRVIMLPTEKASSPISKMHDRYLQLINGGYKDLTCVPQHLYLISDDESIKEGDWVIANGKLGKYQIDEENRTHDVVAKEGLYPFKSCEYMKKVIASTDSILHIKDNSVPGEIIIELDVPTFSTDFIQAYVKANGIDEVMVKYEDFTNELLDSYIYTTIGGIKLGVTYPFENDSVLGYYDSKEEARIALKTLLDNKAIRKLKLRDDNTVIISQIPEDKYTKEEVIKLVKSAWNTGDIHGGPITDEPTCRATVEFEQWIKNHL